MNKVFKAKITYTIDNEHPDKQYVKDWTEDKVFDYEDTYYFDDNFYSDDTEEMIAHIKGDLRLVAGGGYNSDHIHNVKFEIKDVA